MLIGKRTHQFRQIGTRGGSLPTLRKRLRCALEFNGRHRPELFRGKPQQAESHGHHLIPWKGGDARCGIQGRDGVVSPAAPPKVVIRRSLTIAA